MMSSELISRSLKLKRALQGLSQKGLASMCNLSQAQVSKLETNSYKNGNIPFEVKEKVLKILESESADEINFVLEDFNFKSSINNNAKIANGDEDLVQQLLNAMELLVKINSNYRKKILKYESG